MATVKPARTTWIEQLAANPGAWVFFATDPASTEAPVPDGELVMIASNVDPVPPAGREERYRTAMKFLGPTPPSWTSEGPISYVGGSLIIVLDSGANLTGAFKVGRITDPWDESSSLATLQGLTVSYGYPAKETGKISSGHGAPQALFIDELWTAPDYGIMLQMMDDTVGVVGGTFRFRTSPRPYILRHYRYEVSDTEESDATEREDLPAEVLAVLEDREEYRIFTARLTIKLADMDPSLEDIELTPAIGLPALIARSLNWPESWEADDPQAGAIPLSTVRDGDNLDGIRDAVLETDIELTDKTGETYTVAKQVHIVGDATKQTGQGMAELELRSPVASIMETRVLSYYPTTPSEVEYDNASPMAILADAFLNSGRWLYRRMHYNGIAALHKRFAQVWGALTFTNEDLEDTTVGDLFQLLGPAFGLCISTAADGCIDIWHPGVYSPSRRTHEISWNQTQGDGLILTERGRDKQYSGVAVARESYPAVWRIQYPTAQIEGKDGAGENLYTVTLPDDLFETDSMGIGMAGLGRQLVQRYCNRYLEAEIPLSLQGMKIDIGDTVILTPGPGEDAIPMLVTGNELDPEQGTTTIKAVHYPDALGLHSTWEDDGIRGIWRWRKAASPYYDLTNQAHGSAPDGSWTLITGNPLTAVLTGHWQGSCAKFRASMADGMLDGTAGIADLFDLCLIVNGDLGTPSNPPALGITDATVGTIMAWEFSGSPNRYLILHWAVDDAATTPSIYSNRLGIGIVERVDRSPMPWEAVWYTPYGAIGRSGENLPVAIALEWTDTTIRVFLDRELVIEATDAALDKETLAPTAATLYLENGAGRSRIGCLRHIRQTGQIQERQRLQGFNGLDPYYGPDSLTRRGTRHEGRER